MSNAELIGIGSPIVDMVIQVDDEFLRREVAGAKGGMELVEVDVIERLLAAAAGQPLRSAGGAASNTTVGCAHLGIPSAFIGSVGDDERSEYYRQALREHGCEPRLLVHEFLPTAHVLCLVTPDAERTMRTYLGAAAALDPATIRADHFEGARMVMLEGYTLFNHDLTRAIAAAAKEAGCKLALDLASFEVVQANRAVIEEILDHRVDLVFANEDEATAWNDGGIEAALDDLAARCEIAVVKLGSEGAWIAGAGQRHHVEAVHVDQPLDTTGAGDTWAAGFIAAHLRGCPLDVCGHIGALAGAAVVQVAGAQLPREEWQRIRGYLEAQA